MRASRGEIKIHEILEANDINFKEEYEFAGLKAPSGRPLRFDFAVFETPEDLERERPKFLIEMQGEQHYKQKFQSKEAFARQQANDKRKRNYCNAKGYVLVAIPYTELNSMTLDSILEQGKFFD